MLHGRTQIWNKSGCTHQNLPVGQQGIRVLGVPIGQEEYIKNLAKKSDEHQVLIDRIPLVQDLQAPWLFVVLLWKVSGDVLVAVSQAAVHS